MAPLLKSDHNDVDNCDVVDGPTNEFGFVELSPGFANVVTDLDAPQQK